MMNRVALPCVVLLCFVFLYAPITPAQDPFVFSDVAAERGLSGPLQGMMAHAMACGDIDNDGDLDIYLGTYCDRPPKDYLGRSGPVPNMLLMKNLPKLK